MGFTCGSQFITPKSAKLHFKYRWTCKKYKETRQISKHASTKIPKQTTLLWNNGEKERKEDYPTSATYFCRCRINFLSTFAVVP